MQGFLIGVFIYSFILTIVLLYKDNSSYYDIETIDLIVSGPITWVLLLIFYIIRSILKLIPKKEKPKKPYKKKDKKYITKVVKKIVKIYRTKKNHNDYISFDVCLEWDFNYSYNGWGFLMVKKPINERINNKFKTLMYKQKEETIEELKKYFIKLNKEIMIEDDCAEWYIQEYCNKDLYKLKNN